MSATSELPLPRYKEVEERLGVSVLYGLRKIKPEISILPTMNLIERAFSHCAYLFDVDDSRLAKLVTFDDTIDTVAFSLTYTEFTVTTFYVDDNVVAILTKLDLYIMLLDPECPLLWTDDLLEAYSRCGGSVDDFADSYALNQHDTFACLQQMACLRDEYCARLKVLLSSGW